MKICFHEHAWADYRYWQKADPKKLKRINDLIRAIQRDPFQGVGKPEPLRGNWTGFWSRRIDRAHRLVYAVEGDALLIAQCRFHY
ncbi:Txe/YoeB family addiction module toxin [Wenzhouxiangella sediminis]|uniref:Putative mRNA interferase YoeB n=1 Tax=Wenzhouxiangella sediminis TaxID=1792836 RepID=A0A3E1K751_9GAMM|nr:Txe/YoeB family addiction module toxin [Wenzhouxiangella sediminis]RFF29803.1 Txe/YoeB family addiction module toxin [Wenzhouxiangella sediminis]